VTGARPHGPHGPLGPLGRRLLGAFVLVALAAVALVAGAGLVGSSLGLERSTAASREAAAARVAAEAARAYGAAGGWEGADLTPAVTTASAAGARLSVLDDRGRAVVSRGGGMGMGGMGNGMNGPAAVGVDAPFVVGGARVGTVLVAFPAAGAEGRSLAWSWILAAAVVAVLVAAAAGALVVRALTGPLVALTDATRRFAAGDVTARPDRRGAGELGELARAFDQAADAVQAHDRARRLLTADVAHAVRTPLTALQAGLEEVRDGLVPADAATLTRLHDQALRLSRTVEELSALSAADAAAADLHLQDVDLLALTAEAVAARAPQLRAAGLTTGAPSAPSGEPVPARVDPDRYHEVVGTLLDNCARHCRAGDAVRVALSVPGPGRVRLTVADTGPGIPAEDLPSVLERFRRGRDRHTAPGSGVGLAVVARLVEAHGGTVRVLSDGRTGTTVEVDLPADGGRGAQAVRESTTSVSTA
jgi:two-component system, OmpR family, sensor histidine kinase BaeS